MSDTLTVDNDKKNCCMGKAYRLNLIKFCHSQEVVVMIIYELLFLFPYKTCILVSH